MQDKNLFDFISAQMTFSNLTSFKRRDGGVATKFRLGGGTDSDWGTDSDESKPPIPKF